MSRWWVQMRLLVGRVRCFSSRGWKCKPISNQTLLCCCYKPRRVLLTPLRGEQSCSSVSGGSVNLRSSVLAACSSAEMLEACGRNTASRSYYTLITCIAWKPVREAPAGSLESACFSWSSASASLRIMLRCRNRAGGGLLNRDAP